MVYKRDCKAKEDCQWGGEGVVLKAAYSDVSCEVKVGAAYEVVVIISFLAFL